MKPIHIGLMLAAAALGGALFTKMVSSPEPAAQPAVTASVPAAPAPTAEAAPVEQVTPEPKPAPEPRTASERTGHWTRPVPAGRRFPRA